jgi:hypothetical protein
MLVSWRAALCAAPTILVLAGSAWLAHRAQTGSRPQGEMDPTGGTTVVWPSEADYDRLHRVALKQETVLDLLDGRLTFEAAAERFLELTIASPETLANLRQTSFGDTDEERAVHQLLVFARVQAARDRARYGDALARLELEAQSARASRAVTR